MKISKRSIIKIHLTLLILLILMISTGQVQAAILTSDKVISWNPGIPSGVPARTKICANVKNAPYNAAGNGISDDTASINQAIAACPAGEVVYLPAGTYKISANIKINKGIVLRGAGPGKTKILETGIPIGYAYLQIGGTGFGPYIDITAGFTKNSTSINLADASTISSGDYLMIDQRNDNTFATVTNIGSGGACTWCNEFGDDGSGIGNRALGQIIKVTAKNGNVITFEQPLYWQYVASALPKVKKINMVEYAGLENMTLTQSGNTVKYLVDYNNCAYCWAKNVEFYYGVQKLLSAHYVYRNEYRDSYFHKAYAYGSNQGYCISLADMVTATLVENNILDTCHLAVVLYAGASGNVISYNLSYNVTDSNAIYLQADFTTHAAHPSFNLFEGNIGYKVGHDNYWGSASHQTWLRNRLISNRSGMTGNLRAVTVDKDNQYMNFIGNILGTPDLKYLRYETENLTTSCYWNAPDIYKLGYDAYSDCDAAGNDSTVKATIIRHGNYDYYNNAVIWDPLIADHSIPNSYYLTAKPKFFGSLPWPPIGPDCTPMSGTIPAEQRFLAPVTNILTTK